MYVPPKSISAPAASPVQYWPKSENLLNGGLNLVDREWKIPNNQSMKILNMCWRNGELGKRKGQEYLNEDEAPGGPCRAVNKYLFGNYIIKHCGTKLYKQYIYSGEITELFTVNITQGVFFKFNGKLYYKQRGKYIEISPPDILGDMAVSEVVPYIPTVIINRTPTGGGDTNEQYNRLGAGFINAFITNGSATAFTLTDKGLDATPLVASNDSGATWTLIEGTHFTVNRTTGIVTMGSAPATNTNVFRVKAYKTNQDDIDTILDSNYVIPFGGQNDNRVFVGGGNGGYYYWTGITSAGVDPTYFPYNNYNIIGITDDPIMGFGEQYGVLCIFKERELYGVTYTFDGTTGVFNTFQINSQIGCDCPNTIQLINNNLVWFNSYAGICILRSTANDNDRNVFVISRNIQPQLSKIHMSVLVAATSLDFDGHYWLCFGDDVYLWNYFISPYVDTGNPDESAKRLSWWHWDNINAAGFITNGLTLYYGDRTTGKTIKFRDAFSDFGSAIVSYYRIPLRDLGSSVYEFDVLTMWIDVRTDTRTQLKLTYVMNDEADLETETAMVDVGSFSIPSFAIPTFTLNVVGSRQTFTFQPQEKKIDLFGVEFYNDEVDRDLNVSNVVIAYKLGKKKR